MPRINIDQLEKSISTLVLLAISLLYYFSVVAPLEALYGSSLYYNCTKQST